MDFNIEEKNYWKLLSKSLITPYAPKYKIYDFKKYIKKIQGPLIQAGSFNKSISRQSNFDRDTITENTSVFDDSFNKIHNNNNVDPKEETLKQQQNKKNSMIMKKSLKKSNSYTDIYEDLLTILTKKTAKPEETTIKSYNNLSVLEKIRPRLRSFLFLTHPVSNGSQTVLKNKFILNKMILEIRRKSCSCRDCGGINKKLQKHLNIITDKERKTIMEINDSLTKDKIDKNKAQAIQVPKRRFFNDEKRSSLLAEESKLVNKIHRNTEFEKGRDKLEPNNQILSLKYTPFRTKLQKILNSRPSTNQKFVTTHESLLLVHSNRSSIQKKSLKTSMEGEDKAITFLSKNRKSSSQKGYLNIEDKTNSERNNSFLNSIKKTLFMEKEEKNKKFLEQLDLKPYNNRFFLTVSKKLSLARSNQKNNQLNRTVGRSTLKNHASIKNQQEIPRIKFVNNKNNL